MLSTDVLNSTITDDITSFTDTHCKTLCIYHLKDHRLIRIQFTEEELMLILFLSNNIPYLYWRFVSLLTEIYFHEIPWPELLSHPLAKLIQHDIALFQIHVQQELYNRLQIIIAMMFHRFSQIGRNDFVIPSLPS